MDQAAPKPEGRAPARMDLTQGPISRTLLLFSLPVLGTSAVQSLNGSINALWVGRLLGPDALAATANGAILLLFMLGIFFGIGMAATILVGQAVGAKDLTRAKRVVGASAAFFAAISLIIGALGFFGAGLILDWLSTPPQVRDMAGAYMRLVFLSTPFISLFAFVTMAQRGAGDAKTPFWFNTLATLLDVALNPLLILGVGPFPRLGIEGSAISLLVSQGVGLFSMIAYLYWRKADLRLVGAELRFLRPDPALVRTLVLKGLPMGAQIMVISFSGLLMLSMINAYGAATAAAYGVAMQLWAYIQMPAMAIGAAASSMAAQSIGAKKWDRVEATARAGVLINVIMTGALVALLYVLDPYVVGWFLPGQVGAAAIAEHINSVASWSFILFGIMFVLFGVVRATGAATPPLLILAFSLMVVRVGFATWLQPAWGADAIWWSFPISMCVAAALALAYYRWGGWRRARMDGP